METTYTNKKKKLKNKNSNSILLLFFIKNKYVKYGIANNTLFLQKIKRLNTMSIYILTNKIHGQKKNTHSSHQKTAMITRSCGWSFGITGDCSSR
jgi:hypothetical protein